MKNEGKTIKVVQGLGKNQTSYCMIGKSFMKAFAFKHEGVLHHLPFWKGRRPSSIDFLDPLITV